MHIKAKPKSTIAGILFIRHWKPLLLSVFLYFVIFLICLYYFAEHAMGIHFAVSILNIIPPIILTVVFHWIYYSFYVEHLSKTELILADKRLKITGKGYLFLHSVDVALNEIKQIQLGQSLSNIEHLSANHPLYGELIMDVKQGMLTVQTNSKKYVFMHMDIVVDSGELAELFVQLEEMGVPLSVSRL